MQDQQIQTKIVNEPDRVHHSLALVTPRFAFCTSQPNMIAPSPQA